MMAAPANYRSTCSQIFCPAETIAARPGGGRSAAPAGSGRPAAREQLAEKDREQAGDDGDIKSGDGDDVRRAGPLIGCSQAIRQVVIQAQQDAVEQGRFRLGHNLVDYLVRMQPPTVEQADQRVAGSPLQQAGPGKAHL
jgi:hypothetical protein